MDKTTSKYRRIYGMTLQQISDQLGLSIGTTFDLLHGKIRKRQRKTLEKFRTFKVDGMPPWGMK